MKTNIVIDISPPIPSGIILNLDEHERFLQIDTTIIDGRWSSISEAPKIASLRCL